MATTTRPTYPIEVIEVSREELEAVLDGACRGLLGISGEECSG